MDLSKYTENNISEAEKQKIEEMRICGFDDSMDVARNILHSAHSSLLEGDLIFAYRNTSPSKSTSLFQVVVVNDLKNENVKGMFITVPTPFYSVSIITSGYTALLPHMPIGYLQEVIKELEDGKVDKNIIENFKAIVEDQEQKQGGKK